MTKRKPRCIDHNGNTIVLPHRPLGDVRPCDRPWNANDRRKLAQGNYNARGGKTMKITLPEEPWAQRGDTT